VGVSRLGESRKPRVEQAIRSGSWRATAGGRWEASMQFSYQATWNGTWYANKKVRRVFVELPAEIVVVTVYAFFF
jgi:hypothetical protein